MWCSSRPSPFRFPRFASFALAWLCSPASFLPAQEPENEAEPGVTGPTPAQAKTPPEAPATLQARDFAPAGMVGSVISLAVADDGTVYVTQTYRRNNGEPDIRKNASWLEASLASRSVEDKRKLITSRMKDWQKMAAFEEKIIRLRDLDGDGKADERSVHFSGLNNEVDGLAAGVAWWNGWLYLTCTPGFYRLPDHTRAADGPVKAKPLAYGFGIHIGYGGHDMHGAMMGPDGRLYWSQGDRGAMVKDEKGVTHASPCEGAVFRIEPDGTGFEIFADGLRNPQEIAFDEWGHLFTVDNDGDFGDEERWAFIPRGSDSGWRMSYQFRSSKPWGSKEAYNPWMDDGLYKPAQAGQPAYLTPPLSNYSAGPIGFVRNPGTALNARYRDFYFLAHSNKRVTAFRSEPVGAGFRMVDEHEVLRGPFVTGIEFGPDGALYGADWGDNKWEPHENGRVVVLDDPSPAAKAEPSRASTKAWLAKGAKTLPLAGLEAALAHPDQRVRMEAQFALVRHGAEGEAVLRRTASDPKAALPARAHAIWGLGQLSRRSPEIAESAFLPLLTDPQAEVRAQAARVLGESLFTPAGREAAGRALVPLLAEAEPRVRLQAGIALDHIGGAFHWDAALTLLEQNAGADRYLRHAGVLALMGAGRAAPERLSALADHASPEVRLAAVVALRRLEQGVLLTAFLKDASPDVAAEAARAIHDDESLPEGLPVLAETLAALPPRAPEAWTRRAVSANRRLGSSDAALRLADFLAKGPAAASAKVRADAFETLATWAEPLPLDRVQGWYRGLPASSKEAAHAALDRCVSAGLGDPEALVRTAATLAVQKLGYTQALPRLEDTALNAAAPAGQRQSSLEALWALKSARLGEALRLSLGAGDASLRTRALALLAETEPQAAEIAPALEKALASDVLMERQAGWELLGKRRDESARSRLETAFSALEKGGLPEGERLDVFLAAKAGGDDALKKRVSRLEAAALGKDPFVGTLELALEGGDAARGRQVAEGHLAAQCTGCHRLDTPPPGATPGTGPDLAGIGGKRDRAHLLRALVNPSADIDEAYKLTQFTLKNGETLFGTAASETPETVVIRQPGATSPDADRAVPVKDIASRQSQQVSIMPPMGALLTPREVRDLVEFLAKHTEDAGTR